MELSDIKKLSQILQENGDKILDGSSKLSISINLLQYLNESFNLIIDQKDVINTTFQVIHSSNSRLEIFRDLQFLHDFIQKVIGLKISVGCINDLFEGTADISKFRSLKFLEIRKVPINFISGIKNLRSQIQHCVCIKCLNSSIDEFLVECGSDNSNAFVWTELRDISFANNNLASISTISLECVPFLQVLDLSHNRLTDAQPLQCLHNLKHLNLSYNQLERLPLFSSEQSKTLLSLYVTNNYIDDLTGLINLLNLRDLDASWNCLIDHSTLSAIPLLANLQVLSLEGNPLSYHPYHRKITAKYLHSNTNSVKFVLNHVQLSNAERLHIGTYHTCSTRLRNRPENLLSSVTSNVSSVNISTPLPSLNIESQTLLKPRLVRSQRKSGRVRQALIDEQTLSTNKETVNKEDMPSTSTPIKNPLETSIEHLETKKQIEDLRNKFGDLWLHSQGGSTLVENVLGMEKTSFPIPAVSPSYFNDFLIIEKSLPPPPPPSLVTENIKIDLKGTLIESQEKESTTETFKTANVSEVVESEYNSAIDTTYENEEINEDENDKIEKKREEEEDANSHLFIVQLENNNGRIDELFLCINICSKTIRERYASTGVIRERWPLSILESCERTERGVLLKFDTVKRDKQARDYILQDLSEAQTLIDILREILSARPLQEMNQTVYRCMRCSAQFSQEIDGKLLPICKSSDDKSLPTCPTCNSTIVMEVEDEKKPVQALFKTRDLSPERAEIALPNSPSHSSIAIEEQTTVNTSQLVKIVTADVHTLAAHNPQSNLQLQPSRSATSLEGSTTSSRIADNLAKKGDSDIEVLSDPSQESIEVLAVLAKGASVTPKRRRSSEERRVELVTVHSTEQKEMITKNNFDNSKLSALKLAAATGLTESSSSDSLTGSICTAYETRANQSIKTQILENTPIEEIGSSNDSEAIADEPRKAETVGILSSVLEGLWNASKIVSLSSSPLKSQLTSSTLSSSTDKVEFSYNDFTQIDHRVKLHLYLNIFEDETEELVWLLRAEILTNSTDQPFSGCAVLSTHKIYILKIEGNNISDEPQEWLHKSESYTVDRLQTLFTLPWKQGIGFEIRQSSLVGYESVIYILCFLQDLFRTSNFLSHLAGASLPDSCELVTKSSERTHLNIQQLMLSCASETNEDPSLCLLHVFTQCEIIIDNNDDSETETDQRILNMGVLMVTTSDLILTNDNLAWMQPETTKVPLIASTQTISNLIQVNLMSATTLKLVFLDERMNKEENWVITTVSDRALNVIVDAIRIPWETLFSVPMQVIAQASTIEN